MAKTEQRAEPIQALLKEGRKFPPPKGFTKAARVKGPAIYKEAKSNSVRFWEKQARELRWMKPWKKTQEWKLPYAKWFVGGKLNVSDNCLDRHVEGPRRNKAAFIWEGEPGDTRVLTYWDLYREVNRFASALRKHGVKKGDAVTIYMPMIPELPIAMLACARIGAPHSVVFGGFSPESLRDRINDCKSKVVITADGGWRRGGQVALKKNTDEALKECAFVTTVIVYKRTGQEINWQHDRDVWWHDFVKDADAYVKPEPMDAEDMLYLLYTSGSTGKPKGIVHTTGGYLTGVSATHRMIFDLREEDVYWCTADIGWVTGHSYIVYGPLANGATGVMYEGTPDFPDKDRFWRIVEKYAVTILYTAPTAIRTFVRWGDDYPKRCNLSSLRLLGTVGEPINPEAWVWYWKVIGGGRCPIVDTWWQTETGHILISPLPGLTTCKPGSATFPFPGIEADVVNDKGQSVDAGYLVIKRPWPGMLRGIYGDPERFVKQYWSQVPGVYFTGDGAKRDKDGYLWLLGRIDDVMNVSGHRVSTMEVESALVDHPSVAEAAVIGRTHEIKGQAIAAFVTIKAGRPQTEDLKKEIREHVAKKIGALARPDDVIYAAELPKTRSGKIMRRLLRDVAEGRALGDTTTLADAAVVSELKKKYEDKEG
ncbi:MAG: acetate--CoA ligase [Candidatus Rokuibacteriota bacterium]|nr:MAG: acetate--CoA ligase [Candidatus Rokubacteria bacterium]